jgi:1-phosphofructokinase family hexose kinase
MLIAGPNLTIDRTGTLAELRPGAVLRFATMEVTPGGKGVNVARAAQALGVPAVLVGFVPGRIGAAAAAMIEAEGLALRGVPASGELRATTVVMEPSGRTTVINEPGPRLGAGEWHAYEAETADALAAGAHGALVCSGSVPPGVPGDAYGRLVELARGRGVRALVDTSGDALAGALAAHPDVVLPNLGEAEQLLGTGSGEDVDAVADARPRALAAARALVDHGARAAIVTAAAAGAALVEGGGAVWLAAPTVTVRNPVGAGDAFAAGFAAALEGGADVQAAARAAIAVGAASVERALAGELDAARAAELAGLVEVAPEPPG